ncbi:hypothetical protein BJ742DRAFT_218998 [Cladochytrium replicatum]|nr:hypothetical protein BJ742DRAFT_218998 [Cladochytrium replicatum]
MMFTTLVFFLSVRSFYIYGAYFCDVWLLAVLFGTLFLARFVLLSFLPSSVSILNVFMYAQKKDVGIQISNMPPNLCVGTMQSDSSVRKVF